MDAIVYGDTFYRSHTMRECADAYLSLLPTDVTHLISRGSSGCAIASAMLALSKGRYDT